MSEANVGRSASISWADEMRIGLIGQVRRVWSPIGLKIVQKIQISYKYIYLHLAVDGLKGTLQWLWADNMKQEAVIEAVKKWQEAGIDVLVWDGASSHRANAVQALKPVMITQPSYSPEVNPAERVFEAIRAEVEGTVYETLAKKKEAVEISFEF